MEGGSGERSTGVGEMVECGRNRAGLVVGHRGLTREPEMKEGGGWGRK